MGEPSVARAAVAGQDVVVNLAYDYRVSGAATADSIQAALDYLVQQPFVKKADAVIVGQSAGGWGALALASRNPRNVKAVINFAGGRGGHAGGRPNNNCKPERLIAAAGSFGASARIPVLSILVEGAHIPAVLAAALTLVAAFVLRFVFHALVVYAPRRSGRRAAQPDAAPTAVGGRTLE